MIKLTRSLERFLFDNYKDILIPLSFGHQELLTEDIWNDYIDWCQTEEGKSYLLGGKNYKEVV